MSISKQNVGLAAALMAALFSSPSGAAAIPWAVQTHTDPMTDKTSAMAMGVSADLIGSVAFKCDEAGPDSLYFGAATTRFLGIKGANADIRQMLVRFDSDEPIEITANYSGNIAYVRPDRTRLNAQLLARALTAQKVAVRLLTFNDTAIDFSVSLGGAAPLITQVQSICGSAK